MEKNLVIMYCKRFVCLFVFLNPGSNLICFDNGLL